MNGRRKDKQGKRVLFVGVVFVLISLISTLQKCDKEVSCLGHYINRHRQNPLDIDLWKTKLCSLLKPSSCTRPTRITLIEYEDFSFENVRSNVSSSDTYDSYTVMLVNCLKWFQHKNHHHIAHDRQMERGTFIYNSISQDLFKRIELNLNNTKHEHVKLCSFTDEIKNNEQKSVVLNKLPTIFSVNHIIDDYLNKKKWHGIKVLLFATQESNCSLLLHDVLIFMTAFNFVPGTYNFSYEHYHPNLSISQQLYENDIYITEDGLSYVKNWMLFKLPFYILYLYVVVKIWLFTGKAFESKLLYRFIYRYTRRFSTYLCNPLLISTNTPCMNMLTTYILERAWYRKITIISSSFFTTFTMLHILSDATHLFDSNQEEFISVFYCVLLFILFLIESVIKCFSNNVKFLPEPSEAFELSILTTAMPFCLPLLFIKKFNMLKVLYDTNYRTVNYEIESKYREISLHIPAFNQVNMNMIKRFILSCVIGVVSVCCHQGFRNDILTLVLSTALICSILNIYLSNIVYWILRTMMWIYLLLSLNLIRRFLQHFVNLYNEYIIWILSIQIWVPLIFLYISYLKDVLHEYNGFFKHYIKIVISLMETDDCNNAENIAILADRDHTSRIPLINGRYQMFPRAILFYHRGVPHITPKFFYEIRNLLSQVLGSSLSIKMIILKELLSFFLRMFPAIITIMVINTSNLPLDKFEPVQSFFVGSILFHSYSKLFLQRVSLNIDILSQPYLKSKLQDLIRDHNDVFYITHASKQKVKFPVIPIGMRIVIVITGVLIVYIVYRSGTGNDPFNINVIYFELSDYYLKSRIFTFAIDAVFISFLLHFVLLHFIRQ